jgi:hypothetical protein
MPALLGFLHIAVAIFFAVHAVRHGRNNYWLFILLAFPFLGSVVYFFAEYLPEVRHTRVARKAVGAVTALIDPGRDLRFARADFERTPSVEHRARLADALLAAGNGAEAVEHYRQCVGGHYAKDAKLRVGLARALFASGQAREAANTLRSLFADEPERYADANALLLARAVAEFDEGQAIAAFDEALQRHPTTETRCAYGLYLAGLGRDARARSLLEHAMRDGRLGGEHARELNREALDQANAALRALDERARNTAP